MAQDILGTSPEIDLRKRWALMQLQNASSGTPTTGIGALARALQGAIGGYAGYQADQEDKAAGANLFGGGAGSLPGLGITPQPTPSVPAAPASPSPMPDVPMAGAPRGIRNNNPGNIEDGPFARKIPGYAGSDGRFARFDSPQGGQTAIDSLLASYGARGINNVSGVINRWAPPTDNNPTSAYAGFVAKGMGIDPNAQIDLSDPATRQKIGALIGQFENGQKPTQVASLGGGMPASPQMPPADPQMAQNRQGVIPPTPNRASVQIPPDVAASIQRLGADPRTRPQAMQLYLQYAKPIEKFAQGVDPTTGVPFQQNTVTGKKEADPTKVESPNSVREYEYYKKTLSPGEKPMDYATFSTAKARAGATNISNNVDLNSGQTYDKLLAEGLGKSHAALSNGVEEAQARARDIAAMQGAIDTIQKNGGTTGGMGQAQIQELKKTVNAGANAIGISTPFNENDISDKEFLQKFNRAMAGAQAKGAVGSRVTNFELSNFLKANPGLDMSITGNQRLLGIQSQIEQRNIAVGNAIREATAGAISKGQKIDPVTVQKIVLEYDAAHHISDPVNGQDLTQSYTLPEFQKSGENPAMAVGHEQNINGIKIKRVK